MMRLLECPLCSHVVEFRTEGTDAFSRLISPYNWIVDGFTFWFSADTRDIDACSSKTVQFVIELEENCFCANCTDGALD